MSASNKGSESKGGNALGTLAVIVLFAFGIAVPAIVLFSNGNHKASAGPDNMHLTSNEVAGRELFAKSCFYCHGLSNTRSFARTGPDLDVLLRNETRKGRINLVEETIEYGVHGGPGQMPALLYRGKEAKDVAEYVATVAGVGVQHESVEPGGLPELQSASAGKAAREAAEPKASTAELAKGKEVFMGETGCAGCHALADAGAAATIGPDLDERRPSFANVVRQVKNGGGGGSRIMPALGAALSQEEVEAVAAYVSTVAGKK